MEEKKKRKRRAYLDSFQRGSDGKYVYQGEFYSFSEKNRTFHQEMLRLWVSAAVLMAALSAAGCIGGPGTGNCFYVLMPYVFHVIAAISLLWGLGRLSVNKKPLRAYVYEETAARLPVRAVLSAFCAGAAVLGEGIYVFRNGTEGKTAGCILFLLMELLAGLTGILFKKQVSEMKWDKIPEKQT